MAATLGLNLSREYPNIILYRSVKMTEQMRAENDRINFQLITDNSGFFHNSEQNRSQLHSGRELNRIESTVPFRFFIKEIVKILHVDYRTHSDKAVMQYIDCEFCNKRVTAAYGQPEQITDRKSVV